MNVEELLNAKEIYFYPQGKDYVVHCFNPEHDDSSPSTRVDKISGVFNCLSCGHKGNIFDLFNEYRDLNTEKVHAIRRKIREIITCTVGLTIPEGATPFNREFRGIKASTFRELNAFRHSDFEDRIVFPLYDPSKKITAFCARHMLSDASPKYIVYPAEAKMIMFPSIVKPYLGNIIIVEGIFDAINLMDKGLTNVVCLFGTQTLSYNNISERLLPILLTGAKSITLILDGDKAGRKAAEDLKNLIKLKTRLAVDSLELAEGVDPGSLSLEQVTQLKAALYEKDVHV